MRIAARRPAVRARYPLIFLGFPTSSRPVPPYPAFLSYLVCSQSLPLLAALLVFQLTAHTVIRAEERWCRQTFGAAYERYCGSVRRYL